MNYKFIILFLFCLGIVQGCKAMDGEALARPIPEEEHQEEDHQEIERIVPVSVRDLINRLCDEPTSEGREEIQRLLLIDLKDNFHLIFRVAASHMAENRRREASQDQDPSVVNNSNLDRTENRAQGEGTLEDGGDPEHQDGSSQLDAINENSGIPWWDILREAAVFSTGVIAGRLTSSTDKEAQERLVRLENEREELEAALRENPQRNEALERELQDVSVQLGQLKAENVALKQKEEDLEAKLEGEKASFEVVRKGYIDRIDRLEGEMQSLKNRLNQNRGASRGSRK